MLQDYNNKILEENVDLIIGDIATRGTMEIHGGTSRSYPKKSFRITFDKGIKSSLIFDSLFVDSADYEVHSLVLNAATIDNSRFRNYLSMIVTKWAGGTVPQIGFTNLSINGNYYGFYSTIEKVNSRFVEKNRKHSSYDLLKASGWGADLFNGAENFEVKEGNRTALENFSDNLTNSVYTYDELIELTDLQSVNAYIFGGMYTDESDGYGKNYYFLHEKLEDKVSLIRWDADATFGRKWDASIKSYRRDISAIVERNALFKELSKSEEWRNDFYDYSKELFNENLTSNLLLTLNKLDTQYHHSIVTDLQKWGPSLDSLIYGDKGWEPAWDRSLSAEELFRSQLDELEAFIDGREDYIVSDVSNYRESNIGDEENE